MMYVMYRKEGVYILKIKNYILFAQHVYVQVPDTQQFYKVTKKFLKYMYR